MGCLAPKAIERQQKGDKLHYYIFDVWAYGGHSKMNTKIEERVRLLDDMYNEWCDAGNHERPEAIVEIDFAAYWDGENLWETLQKTLEKGGEGIVMTKKGTVPSPGKRTARKTLKVKKELQENIDCFFTGRGTAPTRLYTGKEIEGWKYWQDIRTGNKMEGALYKEYRNGGTIEPITKPFFYGWAGSLEIGVLKDGQVYPIGYLSGLEDAVKADPGAQAMKCIEVTAMEILETGGIRHAKLERFRPDLAPSDCTYEKYMRNE
jgi:ATP-dependent DNA ligase